MPKLPGVNKRYWFDDLTQWTFGYDRVGCDGGCLAIGFEDRVRRLSVHYFPEHRNE